MILRILLIATLLVLSGDLCAMKVDGNTVPIHGVFQGYLLGFDVDPGAIADRCDPPAGKIVWGVVSFGGWGTLSHLGESYLYAEHCEYVDGTYGEGEITTSADNGDILMATYTNGMSLSPPPVIGFMDYVTFIDGGTGRFSFASGGGIEMGTTDLGDGSFTLQITGVIAYSRK
jgi:hypothetical protein